MKLTADVEKLAKKKGCTPGQIALAWVRAHSGKDGLPAIIPIPGATTPSRIHENSKEIQLSNEDLKELDDMIKKCDVQGDRYPGELAKMQWG